MKGLPVAVALFGLLAVPGNVLAASWVGARLWQEGFFWDALMHARDRAARQQADPQLVAVVRTIAGQVAQQVANLNQINAYVKDQQDSLRFAFAVENPEPSLQIIRSNLDTLTQGSTQIQNNLYFLTARTRLAVSQALADPELTATATQLIGQIQTLQLGLNQLYLDTTATHQLAVSETWGTGEFFRYGADQLLRSVVQVQDSVFAVYNAAYELHVRSRP